MIIRLKLQPYHQYDRDKPSGTRTEPMLIVTDIGTIIQLSNNKRYLDYRGQYSWLTTLHLQLCTRLL